MPTLPQTIISILMAILSIQITKFETMPINYKSWDVIGEIPNSFRPMLGIFVSEFHLQKIDLENNDDLVPLQQICLIRLRRVRFMLNLRQFKRPKVMMFITKKDVLSGSSLTVL